MRDVVLLLPRNVHRVKAQDGARHPTQISMRALAAVEAGCAWLTHLGNVMLTKILMVVSFRSTSEWGRAAEPHYCPAKHGEQRSIRASAGGAPSTNSSCLVVLVRNVASSEQNSTVMHSMLTIETARG